VQEVNPIQSKGGPIEMARILPETGIESSVVLR